MSGENSSCLTTPEAKNTATSKHNITTIRKLNITPLPSKQSSIIVDAMPSDMPENQYSYPALDAELAMDTPPYPIPHTYDGLPQETQMPHDRGYDPSTNGLHEPPSYPSPPAGATYQQMQMPTPVMGNSMSTPMTNQMPTQSEPLKSEEPSNPDSPGRSKPVPKPDRPVTKDANNRFICTWPGCEEAIKDFGRKCEWS
jgi:hypothetical protein